MFSRKEFKIKTTKGTLGAARPQFRSLNRRKSRYAPRYSATRKRGFRTAMQAWLALSLATLGATADIARFG